MKKTKRLIALDAFRGITIATMIMVNTPGSWGSIYSPLRHADWHGCTPTDLVFPFFLFIVGVAMWFSFQKFNGIFNTPAALKILKRTALIFIIGLALNAFPFAIDYSKLRILGVLQRIALAYGFGAILCLWLTPKKLIYSSIVLLLGYWLILFVGSSGNPYELETTIARTIDIALLGENHVWHGKGIPFDPEGLLSTIPSIVTVILGYLTGKTIQQSSSQDKAVLNLFLYGIPLIAAAMVWDYWFPINKSLWTSSYVLYTAGLAMVMLAFFIWLIDVKKYGKWAHPFVVFGTNPLFVYALSILWVKTISKIPSEAYGNGYSWLYQSVFVPIAGNMNGSLLFAVSHIVVFWLILLILYKKKIFIKI